MKTSTRRGFLKTGTGAGLLICSSRTAFGFKANEKLNIAGIGVGGQGVGNIRSVAGENIVALCEVDTKRGQPTLKNFPKVKLYQDYRRMLSEMDKQIDAVVVSTPDHTHAVSAVMAMNQGKHVYCEKPLTRTVYEARVMRLIDERAVLIGDGPRQDEGWPEVSVQLVLKQLREANGLVQSQYAGWASALSV